MKLAHYLSCKWFLNACSTLGTHAEINIHNYGSFCEFSPLSCSIIIANDAKMDVVHRDPCSDKHTYGGFCEFGPFVSAVVGPLGIQHQTPPIVRHPGSKPLDCRDIPTHRSAGEHANAYACVCVADPP